MKTVAMVLAADVYAYGEVDGTLPAGTHVRQLVTKTEVDAAGVARRVSYFQSSADGLRPWVDRRVFDDVQVTTVRGVR